MTISRIIFGLTFLLFVFNAPWWFTFVFACAGVFYFPYYYEIFIFGILIDFLYGVTGFPFFGYGLAGLIASSILFWGAERAKYEFRA